MDKLHWTAWVVGGERDGLSRQKGREKMNLKLYSEFTSFYFAFTAGCYYTKKKKKKVKLGVLEKAIGYVITGFYFFLISQHSSYF